MVQVMSEVGGFLGTTYLIISTILASYLAFVYDKSLMKRLYYQEAQTDAKRYRPSNSRRTDEEELLHRLSNRRSYTFGYFGYLSTKFLRTFCFCFKPCCKNYDKRVSSLQRLEKAREMLTAEKDIESFITMRRITRLLVKVLLEPHQRMAIPFFQRYVLRDKISSELADDDADPRDSLFTNTGPHITADALWDALDPVNSRADRLILYEIARRRIDGFVRDPNMSLSEGDESGSGDEEGDGNDNWLTTGIN